MPLGRTLCLILVLLVGHAAAEECPSDWRNSVTVPAGCPCAAIPGWKVGLCTKGFVCSEPWVGTLLRQASPASHVRRLMQGARASSNASNTAICMTCSYGQYCPQGSVLPITDTPSVQLALTALTCPAGRYCPTPAELYECEPGSFCGVGTVEPTTCNITSLLKEYPALVLPTKPATIYESVYIKGTTLAGNYCPANSSSPAKLCKGGFFCPTPSESITCPDGYYCKAGSQAPSKCPVLTSCPAGSDKANLSWVGFILLAAILAGLWISYLILVTAIRVNQRRLQRTQVARERLWKMLNPIFASHHHSTSFRAFKSIRPKLDLEYTNLGLTLHDGTTILSGVTGKFEHSRVSAIMGPSGAGKSTFLSVIMGKAAAMGTVTGHVTVNGRDMHPRELKGIVGFVPQEDIVHEDLTVRENLVYSARLRLSAGKTVKEQMEVVDDVINCLQLRHIQHNVVGSPERRGVSGGQRKRVNIGWELASKPSILFADEPTSGLDSTAAADILDALKRMSRCGMSVITVIHQPRYSIFQAFDDVMLLGKGGKLVYLGPSTLALPYLQMLGFVLPPNENPADFAMDVLSGSVERPGDHSFHPEQLVSAWEAAGALWVKSQGRPVADDSVQRTQEAVDPEQLRVLEEQFDAVDIDRDGGINALELRDMLLGLGVEPTTNDIEMISAELADPKTGLVTKEHLMNYVRYGGRPPTQENIPESKRRVHSLYKVYSIEQNNLTNALAELEAMQLPGRTGQQQGGQQFVARRTTIQILRRTPTIPESEEQQQSSVPTSSNATSSSEEHQVHKQSAVHPSSDSSNRQSLGKQDTAQRQSIVHGGRLRASAGLFGQLKVLLARAAVKWTRQWASKFTDFLLLIFAAVACGAIHGTSSEPNDVRGNTALIMLTLGILSTTTALAVFGKDRLVFWRERATGLRVLPYFVANTTVNLVDVVLFPLVFISIYHSMTLPAIPFGLHYVVSVLVVWWCSSAGCLISVLVGQPSNALVAAVAVVMVTGGFINGVTPAYRSMGNSMRKMTALSYNRWAVEAVTIGTFRNYPEYIWPLTRALMNRAGHCGLVHSSIPVIGTGMGAPVVTSPGEGDTWEDVPMNVTAINTEELEEQDISVYCEGYLMYSLLVIFLEGLVLRIGTLLALYFCPRGLTLEPLVVALGRGMQAIKGWMRTPRRRKAHAATVSPALQQYQ